MSTFASRLKSLRKMKKLTQESMATQINEQYNVKINKGMLSKWENGKEEASMANMRILSRYFNCSLDYLLGLEDELARSTDWAAPPELTSKDEKDIAKDLASTLNQLESSQSALMFDGEPMDDETRELLKISLENSIRLGKQIAKQKYTNKRYKKD